MFLALPIFALLALLLLGGLAAAVYGIVYAIVNKRPGVALGYVLVPVLGFFAVLVGMMFIGVWQGYINGPVSVSLNDGPAVPDVPGVPAMPNMPPMLPVGNLGDQSLVSVKGSALIILGVMCLVLVGIFRKRTACEGQVWRGKKLAVMVAIAVAVIAAIHSARHSTHRTSFARNESQEGAVRTQFAMNEQARRDQDAARQKIKHAQRMADEAAEMAAAAQHDGKNFQEMLETLNKPRITLDASAKVTKLSVETETSPAAEISTADGETKFVVPISDETQQSLARSAAHLEQMVERVSKMAEQVSDAGTLLGRAMVALNERIDSHDESQPKFDVAANRELPPPLPDPKPVADVNVVAVSTSESAALPESIELDSPNQTSIEIEIDREKLNRSGLTFEKLRDILSRDGLWNGTVVRFDPHNSRITVKGDLDERYVVNLNNTLIQSQGWQHQPIHLADLAVVNAADNLPKIETHDSNPPQWVAEPPKRVGNTWREVIESSEYSTVEECYRAADIYLLWATYDHLIQLTGVTPQTADGWRSSLTFQNGNVIADGQIIISDRWPNEYRLQRLSSMGIGIDFIRREIARDEYVDTTQRSFGPMKNLYTLVEFTPSVDGELIRRWNDYRRDERFAVVGTGAGSVLGLIGIVFGLLKVDTWTKGYYTKRLFLGVPAAIIGVLALLGLAAG